MQKLGQRIYKKSILLHTPIRVSACTYTVRFQMLLQYRTPSLPPKQNKKKKSAIRRTVAQAGYMICNNVKTLRQVAKQGTKIKVWV